MRQAVAKGVVHRRHKSAVDVLEGSLSSESTKRKHFAQRSSARFADGKGLKITSVIMILVTLSALFMCAFLSCLRHMSQSVVFGTYCVCLRFIPYASERNLHFPQNRQRSRNWPEGAGAVRIYLYIMYVIVFHTTYLPIVRQSLSLSPPLSLPAGPRKTLLGRKRLARSSITNDI